MSDLKKKLLLIHTIIMLISGWGIWLSMKYIFTIDIFTGYTMLPIAFYLVGIVLIYILINAKKDNPRKLANLYLLLKLAKMGVFLILALIFLLGFKVNHKVFLVVFSLFYLIYSAFEVFTFSQIEKMIKKIG